MVVIIIGFLKNILKGFNKTEKTLEEKNEEYLASRDEEIRRLRDYYDFDSIEGINSISVPCFEPNAKFQRGMLESPIGRVEYYLRGKCFADHWKAGRTELAIACLKKAQELMYISDMIWKRSDFMVLVNYLHKAGYHKEAEKELERIERFFSDEKARVEKSISEDVSASLNLLQTDLVEVGSSGVCCELCAKYRNRIYSVSGKDKRFPKFPTDFHLDCGLRPYPFVWGVSEPTFSCKNVVTYSNRPFEDDRSNEEIERRRQWKERNDAEAEAEKQRECNRLEYFWIQEHLPDLCPKSLSGYSRMKNANSSNYQRLVDEARKLGKTL